MTVLNRLATSLGRKDEEPNVELARAIAEESDEDAVRVLADNLRHKNKSIQSDCIKVLYEIGAIDPAMIAGYDREFVALLGSTNNRLVWGAMTALDAIASVKPEAIYDSLPAILEAADKGSVIAKDHAVGILIKLLSIDRFAGQAFAALVEQLRTCPTNQLPMYAENAMSGISAGDKATFVETLLGRLIEIEKDSKRKRVEKVIQKLS